jgi:SWI/SNF-related matrix-associated actin-dependent regulator of chromatin subfamily A-like protein 1
VNLFPYQEEGAEFLVSKSAALLADQPGLGKTAQAIVAARRVFNTNFKPLRICVIAPKTALENWRREWSRWWPGNYKPTIINYDLLSNATQTRVEFNQTDWDLIVCDEAHRLKNAGSNRTQVIYRKVLKQRVRPRVWLLTGTPARNHAGELWSHLRTLRPDLIHDRSGRPMTLPQFEDAYCQVQTDAFGQRNIRGSKNLKELRAKLIGGGFMLRRMKKDVQSELPDLVFDDFPLTGTLKSAVPAMPALGIGVDTPLDDAIAILRREEVHLSTERRLTGLLKAPLVAEYVTDELDAPGKVIVFYHHTEVGNILNDRLIHFKPARVEGGTKDPQGQVDMFQTDPVCQVFLGQITACGEALNITAADRVFFAEASWSPSDNYQAACRAHRIGMGTNLTVKFLSLPGTMDEIIQRVLARKTAELSELFD